VRLGRTVPGTASDRNLSAGLMVLAMDRHPLFADALGVLLAAPSPTSGVLTVHTFDDALEALADDRIGLFLCEAAPAVPAWHRLMKEVVERRPDLPVILLCDQEEDAILSALEAGVEGVFSKAAPAGELIVGMEQVLHGDVVVDSILRAWVGFVASGGGAKARSALHRRLTPDQAAILERLAERRSIAEIAALRRETQKSVVTEMAALYRVARSLQSSGQERHSRQGPHREKTAPRSLS
jgi:DNA-binding NarL/FixJ family response regulator